MKYILIISCVYPPEPVVSARLSADLYQSLKGAGKEVKVLHPRPTRPNGFKLEYTKEQDENIITLDSYTCPQSSTLGRVRETFSFGKACAKYIRCNHNDISCIYVNSWPLGSQYRIVKAARKYAIPVAMHVQDVYPESLTNKLPKYAAKAAETVLLPMDKYILRNSSRVIAISHKMREHLIGSRGIDAQKVCVVVNWQDESDFLEYQSKTVPAGNDKFTLMYMGNIGPVAGVELLIEAFQNLSVPNARLVIAGSGSMKESMKEKAKNNQNIEFWDVPNGKVPEIQSKADVMLLPIKKGAASSSIPSKLPAYMFSAKPIIGSMDKDSYTASAIVESGGGVIVEPENQGALADMMKQMMSMGANELASMGEKGQEYALAHFSKGANLKNLTHVIEQMV